MERRNWLNLFKIDKAVVKETLLLALPMIIQGLVYELQSVTDKAFLGHLKTEYVSAIGAAQLPLFSTMEGIVAIALGITIMVSHLYGAGKEDEAPKYVKSTMIFNFMLGILFFLMWELFADPILRFFKVDILIIDKAVEYVSICAVFFIVIGMDSALNSMLQGLGKTKIIMYSGFIKVFFNIVISWVLIFGKFGFKEYNVAGAAFGTLISNFMAFIFVFVYCFCIKGKEFGLGKFSFKDFSLPVYGKIFKLGAPSCAEFLLWNFSNLMLVRFINEFSYINTSIYTVTFSIQCIVSALYTNYARAGLTLIGHSLGAKNYKKAKDIFHNCMLINLLIAFVVNAVFMVASHQILGVFLKEAEVADMANKYLLLVGFIMIPQSFNIVCGNAIKGNGNTKWMLYSQMFGSCFIMGTSLIAIRGLHLNMVAIYMIIFFDETIRGAANYFYYRKKYLEGDPVESLVI